MPELYETANLAGEEVRRANHVLQTQDITSASQANLLVVLLRVEQHNGARGRSREILPGAGKTHQGTEAGAWA